jgi:hypothetical protein
MKIRVNLKYVQLAPILGLAPSTISDYFDKYLRFLKITLKSYFSWSTRDEDRKNLPAVFKPDLVKCRVVLDCTEIPIHRSSRLHCLFRITNNSNFIFLTCIGTTTVKILIGITPNGLICYTSSAYGGKASDKQTFNEENILERLDLADEIMVDKGFAIEVRNEF